MLTAFWLLPLLGLRATVWAAAAVNVVVFLIAATLSQRVPASALPATAPRVPLFADASHSDPAADAGLGRGDFLQRGPLVAGMLGHIVGSSIHAFGVMVASFLSGIALGGGLGAWLATTRERSTHLFILCQFGIAASAVVAFLLLNRHVPARAGLAGNSLFGFMLLLPLTLFIGATYPLAVRILARGPEAAAGASARVYAWNTVGAILGAVSGGFIVIPALRYEGAIHAAVIASVAIGASAALALLARGRRGLPVVVTAVAVIAVAAFRPAVPTMLLLASPLRSPDRGQLALLRRGPQRRCRRALAS